MTCGYVQRIDNVKTGRCSTFKSCVTPALNFLLPVSSVPTFPLTQQSKRLVQLAVYGVLGF